MPRFMTGKYFLILNQVRGHVVLNKTASPERLHRATGRCYMFEFPSQKLLHSMGSPYYVLGSRDPGIVLTNGLVLDLPKLTVKLDSDIVNPS